MQTSDAFTIDVQGILRSPTPLISCLMRVYNTEAFLPAACQSLQAQSYPHWEAVAVDDGSTDGSYACLTDIAAQDERFRVFQQMNVGPAATRHMAFRHVRGEYIAVIDSDDLSAPERFARQVAMLQANPEIAVVGSYYADIDAQGNVLKNVTGTPTDPAALGQAMRERNMICHGSVLIRRDVFEAVGGYRDVLSPAEDYDFFLRCLDAGYQLALLPDSLYSRRIHGAADSARLQLEQMQKEQLIRELMEERAEIGGDWLNRLPSFAHDDAVTVWLNLDLEKRKPQYAQRLAGQGYRYLQAGDRASAIAMLEAAMELSSWWQPMRLRAWDTLRRARREIQV